MMILFIRIIVFFIIVSNEQIVFRKFTVRISFYIQSNLNDILPCLGGARLSYHCNRVLQGRLLLASSISKFGEDCITIPITSDKYLY
jgi:hypothetical protein